MSGSQFKRKPILNSELWRRQQETTTLSFPIWYSTSHIAKKRNMGRAFSLTSWRDMSRKKFIYNNELKIGHYYFYCCCCFCFKNKIILYHRGRQIIVRLQNMGWFTILSQTVKNARCQASCITPANLSVCRALHLMQYLSID